MFTGIVEEIGEVVAVRRGADSAVLSIRCAVVGEDVKHGGSISVDGVCLTVVSDENNVAPGVRVEGSLTRELDFDVMGETLMRSSIGTLQPGSSVNLERALRADGRLDGHVVQGHVDGTASIISRTPGDSWETVRIELPAQLARYVAEKGSIAVSGISLTVSKLGSDWFEVSLIPETLRATTLGVREPGDQVNIEVDVLAKYAERLLTVGAGPAGSPASESVGDRS